LIQRNNFKTR